MAATNPQLKILYLEDSQIDMMLVKDILEKNGTNEMLLEIVSNEKEYINALLHNEYNIVLSDYNLPGYDAPKALTKVKEINPETPFICVSGTIGEEKAVELLKQGADDYVLKDRMGRLWFAIERALEEKKIKKEKQKAEEELIKAKNQAEESDKLKSSFLANMSHEIRTPMNGLLGFTRLLMEGEHDKETQRMYHEVIEKSCEQLIAIFTNILDISLIQSNQISTSESQVNINELMVQIYEGFLPVCQKKGIALLFKPGLNVDIYITTDEAKLVKILNNLLDNALKFTHKGYIELGYKQKNNLLEFYIKDTGIGIHEDHHDIIFESFRQIELEHTKNYGGNGLGLPISKAFIESLNGNLELESTPGSGSTFKFTLPTRENTVKIESGHVKENSKTDFSQLRILVAEDELYNYMYLSELLNDTGAFILWASNGREAFEKFKGDPSINIILMDIRMPEMDGIEATRRIKSIKDIPIIAVTSYAAENDRVKILNAGCDDYLVKPFYEKDLYEKIHKWAINTG